jgi:hypothetical protein
MKLLVSIFTGVGILLLFSAAGLFIHEQNFLKKAHMATGKVIELGRSVSSSKSSKSVSYYPVVSFNTAEGKPFTFSSSLSSNPPSYSVGEEVTVYYLPENPQEAEIKGFFSQWLAVIISGFLGLLFSSIGIGTLRHFIQKKRLYQWLEQNGLPLKTHFQSVEYNTHIKINGRSPYVIYSQWLNPENKKVHVFKSDYIYYNPKQFISGDIIEVKVDVANYKKYKMDTSFLPAL